MNEAIKNALQEYKRKGKNIRVTREIKSGKEAVVFAVELSKKQYSLKLYKNPKYRLFKNIKAYKESTYYRQPSIRKAVKKGSKFGKNFLHKAWIRREFYLLKKLKKAGANVPEVIDWTSNSILMEFIGSKEKFAPRLIDINLTKKQAESILADTIRNIKIFLKFGIVHADLSAYNILLWKNKPYIIDFPQSIDIRNNPNRHHMLKRDIRNIVNYFSKYLELNKDNIYKKISKHDV